MLNLVGLGIRELVVHPATALGLDHIHECRDELLAVGILQVPAVGPDGGRLVAHANAETLHVVNEDVEAVTTLHMEAARGDVGLLDQGLLAVLFREGNGLLDQGLGLRFLVLGRQGADGADESGDEERAQFHKASRGS